MGEESKEKKEKSEKVDKRCFVMMPISDQGDYPQGHFTKVYEQIFKPAIEEAGFKPYRVDENKISDAIMSKIFEAIQNCPMALCDLSNKNPNVLYELGLRQAYDKPVVLVKDDETDRIFDVSGISTVEYNSVRLYENVMLARKRITEAILSTRDGKEKTMVKIMKAEIADFSSVDVSQEDKLEIMLRGIKQDIQELKSTSDNRIIPIKNDRNCEEKRIPKHSIIPASGELSRFYEHVFKVRNGITDKQIRTAIREVERMFNGRIHWERISDQINVSYIAPEQADLMILIELMERIGTSE